MSVPESIVRLAAARSQLGECPLWDAARQRLFWTDILGGSLFCWQPLTEEARRIYSGEPVGGLTLEADGALVLFRVGDIARFDPDDGQVQIRPFADYGMARFNDVTADSRGRVYAGTIGRDDQTGGVFRFDTDGTTHLMFRGTGCANGMGFSPDDRTFFWTCSTSRKIFAFDYEAESGDLVDRRLFYACDSAEGVPDGLCVDREGCIWSARWNGACIVRHSPIDGTVLKKVPVPAALVTACCFGGQECSTLFITSAWRPDDGEEDWGGSVFAFSAETPGLPRSPSRLFCLRET